MKTLFITFFLVLAALSSDAGINDVYVTYYNDTSSTIYNGTTAPNVVLNTQFAPIGVYNQFVTFAGGVTGDQPAGSTFTVDYHAGGSGLGYPDCAGAVVQSIGNLSSAPSPFSQGGDNWGVYITGPISWINGVYSPPPAQTSTNVTQCIQNTTGQNVVPYATVGGVPISGGPSVLAPGQSWCYSATLNNDGSSGPFVVGYNIPNPSNPSSPDGGSQSYSPTSGFTDTFTTNNLPPGSTGGTGGGAWTNTFTTTTTNLNTTIWTNNINWAAAAGPTNASTAGLALDVTLKTGFGNLHSDLQGVQTSLSLINQDVNGLATYAAAITNELGQEVLAIYHLTNADQLPAYIGSITNNATQNAHTLNDDIQNLQTSNSAAMTALIQAITNNQSSSPILTNIDATLSGMSNLWSALVDTSTNWDYPTETTQIGISNLLAQMAYGTNNLSLTNYALESTLSGISNFDSVTLSNVTSTNWLSRFYSWLMPSFDVGNATNKGGAAVSGIQAQVGSAQSSAAGLDTGVPAGEAPTFSIDASTAALAGTFVFNIDFESSPWSSIWATAKAMFTWILVVAYLLYVIKALMEQIKIWGSSQAGGIPDADVLGVNAIGALGYLGVTVGFLAFMTAILGGVVSYFVTGSLSLSALIADAGGSSQVFAFADSKAMHLLQAIFPLSFAITLLVTAVIWRLSLFGTSAFVVASIRSIPGR